MRNDGKARRSITATAETSGAVDAESCYRALRSRDRRFEGRFFVGVTSTGVYCRPGCPAPLPERRNTRFFACAAAAEDAGFRACRRCRPDTAPGTPAWSGTSATVSRALRLLLASEGEVPRVDLLAARLGVGARHLRRLFVEHLGAAPRSIAQTHRAHFARQLLDTTDLPIVDIAFASGFGGVRRLHAAMRRAFRASPSELRARRRDISPAFRLVRPSSLAAEAGGEITLRLPYRAPFDWDGILSFLSPRATPGVEQVIDGAYARTFVLDGISGSFAARNDAPKRCVVLTVTTQRPAPLVRLVERVGRLFDLGADPASILDPLSRDPVLAPLLANRPGLRVPGAWDGFECAVRAILGQQITVKGATTLAGRMVNEFGSDATVSRGPLDRLFPHAAALVDADLERVGLTRARADAVRALAGAVIGGEIDFETGGSLESFEQRFVQLPGVGRWTAQYVAMRACGEPNAFPASDLVLRRVLLPPGQPQTERALLARAEAWHPWRAYAAMAAWLSA